ncbi:MAG: response regulator [Candidatus Micrarchaeota archaeon]|nr:response regulator [Candidatus Micrarchaeota archaeon]
MNILCIDDDSIILHFLEQIINKLNIPDCKVITAMTGNKAEEIVKAMKIDIVILDNSLPDVPGITLIKKLKKIEPTLEIIMATGYASIENAVEAMKAGARDYIEKPFTSSLIEEKIRNIIELKERAKEAEEYRRVKEDIEKNANKEISSLEEIIEKVKKCQKKIIEIINSDKSDSEKIALIKEKIETSNII